MQCLGRRISSLLSSASSISSSKLQSPAIGVSRVLSSNLNTPIVDSLVGRIGGLASGSRFSSSKPKWFSMEEWGEERRAEAQRPGATKPYIVHLQPRKNNTFVTVSDADGNKKYSASVGSLHLGKGTSTPRFFAEPVAEHAGQEIIKMGFKSAVVRVKGAVYFRKKRDAILSFRKGTRAAGRDQCQILSIQDVTRLAHNGCRLRKRRRV